jgi:Ion channel
MDTLIKVAAPPSNAAPTGGRRWRCARAVVREAEQLYAPAAGLPAAEAQHRLREIVLEAGTNFAAAGRWEQVFRLFSSVPLPPDTLGNDLLRLRCAAQLYELKRSAHLRRRLKVLLGVVLGYLLAVAPTLFLTLENPRRASQQMSELDWSEGLYWSVLTFTTVGYGDIVPQTPYARLLSLFNALLGVTLMGMLAGLILSLVTPRRLS